MHKAMEAMEDFHWHEPAVELDMDIDSPRGNLGNNAVESLFYVFAETKTRKFVICKDSRASLAELQAGQTPKTRSGQWCIGFSITGS
jgi:hypothetical protein